MKGLRIAGLDAGTRNLGFCVIETPDVQNPIVWMHVDLFPRRRDKGKPTSVEIVTATVHWLRGHRALLESCDVIVLENQMRTPFEILNAVVSAHYLEKVEVLNPRTVGRFWGLPSQRAPKKKAGVSCVAQNGCQFPPVRNKKYDDVADAWLLAVYAAVHRGEVEHVEKYNEELL